ncbi:zinc finger protein 99-like [Scylla paramamosain]|uniref:zinc finger protein 99-like n=1 Tax=Scylla paramamosain TaxID=85552 RepID=UPI00308368A7
MSIHRGLKCEECGRNFSKPESLAAHTALHLTGGTIMCEVCNKLFSSKTRHNSSATTSCTPAQGTSCAGGAGGRTPQSGDLNKHIDAAYGGVGDSEFEEEEEEVLVVPIAHFSDKRKRYRSLGSLRKHQCEECGSRFSHRDVLIKHYSTYTCTKPFQCEEWSKAFARKDILATHALRHTKRRAFTCDDCGTDFWKKSSLRQHVMTHLLPEFKCEVCGKEFRVKVSLENHLRVQCGVKEFACVHCDDIHQIITQPGKSKKMVAQEIGVTKVRVGVPHEASQGVHIGLEGDGAAALSTWGHIQFASLGSASVKGMHWPHVDEVHRWGSSAGLPHHDVPLEVQVHQPLGVYLAHPHTRLLQHTRHLLTSWPGLKEASQRQDATIMS